jgi:hypothetical protein
MRLLAAMVVIALGAMTAHATPPSFSVFTGDYSWSIPCDGYSLTVAFSGDTRQTIFFNEDGTVESMQFQLKNTVNMFRDGFPENALTGIRRDMQKFDPSTGIFEVNGGMVRVVLPSYGPIFFEAGRFIVDTSAGDDVMFIAGKHHFMEGQTEAACEYFR